jgi:hypothetical protein
MRGDREFESVFLHQGVMNKSSQAANLPQAANRPTLTGEGLTVRIPFPPAGSHERTATLLGHFLGIRVYGIRCHSRALTGHAFHSSRFAISSSSREPTSI